MEEHSDRIGGELRAVERRRRESFQNTGNGFRGDGTGFDERAAAEFFRQDGGGSNRRRAASAEKTCFRNAPVNNARRKFEDVAADGIAYLDGNAGAGKLPGVARVSEVIENGFAEHF